MSAIKINLWKVLLGEMIHREIQSRFKPMPTNEEYDKIFNDILEEMKNKIEKILRTPDSKKNRSLKKTNKKKGPATKNAIHKNRYKQTT